MLQGINVLAMLREASSTRRRRIYAGKGLRKRSKKQLFKHRGLEAESEGRRKNPYTKLTLLLARKNSGWGEKD